ncbi:diacylglycerol/lipid kinase family protein [Sphingoaurantiacus capsulatus]|uniref:Diacylglycerol/lipid kinase family protein n=1 Tax=Sphingoaurantiacus capsulatus TaxID=1771310 RepID=A0ABV7XA04_9SPHN
MTDLASTAGPRAVLVVNTKSRKGRHLFKDAKAALTGRGVELDGAYSVRNPERLPEIVRDAVAQGHRFIIVGGGDGTISSVVDHLAHKDVTLGVLPLGTANCFARTLTVPFDLDGAVGVLVDGKTAEVDLGRVGTDLFANALAIGMPSIVNAGIPSNLKKHFGRIGYLIYGIAALLRFKPFRCTVTTDGDRRTFDALEVRVVNGSFLGGLRVAEDSNVESEDMVVQIVQGTRRRQLVGTWLRSMVGRPPAAKRIVTLRGRKIRVETEPSEPVSVDGEVLAQTPIECGVERQSLKVRVPADRDDLD